MRKTKPKLEFIPPQHRELSVVKMHELAYLYLSHIGSRTKKKKAVEGK